METPVECGSLFVKEISEGANRFAATDHIPKILFCIARKY